MLTHWSLGNLTVLFSGKFSHLSDWYLGHSLWNCPHVNALANERQCYNVTLSLIGWVHTQNDPWELNGDTSALVLVMAWCHQAPSHYLLQCWTRSQTPYGITRPQWVKLSKFMAWFQNFGYLLIKSKLIWCLHSLDSLPGCPFSSTASICHNIT